MAKTIDVTMATWRNAGPSAVSPEGVIRMQIVRSLDDKQIFQTQAPYLRLNPNEPIHPSGVRFLGSGDSLVYNITHRFTLDSNKMLIFSTDLEESEHQLIYQGSFNRKVRYHEMEGFKTVECDYNVLDEGVFTHKLIVIYTVNLVFDDGQILSRDTGDQIPSMTDEQIAEKAKAAAGYPEKSS